MPKIKISVLLIFIIIFSCSLNNQFQDKEQLLKKELYKWKTFQIDGVVEINYKTLRFRKDIQILKNENFLKITLFESGIFGLSPTPFLYFYSDSLKTEFKITGKKRTLPALIDGRKFVSLLAIKLSAKNIKEIIDSGKLHYQGAMVYFDGKMRINKIKFNAFSHFYKGFCPWLKGFYCEFQDGIIVRFNLP